MLIDNIIANADIKNQQEYRIFLCKMNREVIREITNQSYNKSYSPQLGGCDSFSFSIPYKYDGKITKNYDDIIGRNLVKIQKGNVDVGYFEIQDVQREFDGLSEIKNIKCLSMEVKLINKHIYLTEGVFKLVDNVNPNKGLLNLITSIAKSWTIGIIDNVLINKERYFDIADTNIYELMNGIVQETYECVFEFDTINKRINAYALANYGRKSKINVSMQNIIESASIEEISNEIVTRLHLYGDNEISVRNVNLGNDFIDNFAYFKSTKFMSQGLIDALNVYDAKVASKQSTYSSYLSQLSTLQAQLLTANSDMLILQGELEALNKTKSYQQSINVSTSAIQVEINNKQAQINTKQSQIDTLNGQINNINNNINIIINDLNMSNNFTTAQIQELDQFIIEDTYQDSSFLTTDNSTYDEIIKVENSLLQSGKNILGRVSYPRYRVNINVIDFLKNKEFAPWWNELYIGDIIRIDVDGRFTTEVRVTGYTHEWDDNNLSIQLGDKYQLDDANIQLMDLIKNSISVGTSVNYERYKYKDYTSNNKNEILEFINSSLDLNKNTVVGGDHQEITIDPTGLLLRRFDTTLGVISPQQLKLTNNAMVLSDDGFVTAKTAIGKLSNGLYGIAAEVVAGKMILGNNMIIETGSGDFRVDGNGVNITKMTLNMTSSDNLKRIQLDPNNGFKISTRPNISTTFTDKFYLDTNGNLQFSGNLNGASGTFSGSLYGAYISGGSINGTTITGGSATFGDTGKVKLSTFGSQGSIEFTGTSGQTVGYITGFQTNGGQTGMSLRAIGGYPLALQSDGNMVLDVSGYLDFGASTVQFSSSNVRFSSVPTVNGNRLLTSGGNETNGYYQGDHNHGIPYGTKLMVEGGGTVTFVPSGGFWHNHTF